MKEFACFNCNERRVGCHAECKIYKEVKAVRDKMNEDPRKENAKRDLALEYTINDMRRKKKERTKK